MNPDLWHTPHRLHPFKQKDCCVSVEATREQWDEVMPFSDPPSEASWRTTDAVIAAIGVGACAFLVFGSVPV
jgi:hypothetical protein